MKRMIVCCIVAGFISGLGCVNIPSKFEAHITVDIRHHIEQQAANTLDYIEGKTDELVEVLGESVSYDARLAPWDIRASIAHATMLGDCGIIAKSEVKKIVQGLKAIDKAIAAGEMTWDRSLEDVHTNIESALVARIGDSGKRLHTGRSRNDQIATDVRLWMRDQIDTIILSLKDLQRALLDLAEAFPMPLEPVIVMETGGMKGRREELTREQLHEVLRDTF